MSTVRLSDIVEPVNFTKYITANTMESTRLVQSGIATKNNVIEEQLRAGAHSFTVPFWRDLGNEEANITNDNPDDHSTPNKLNAGKQLVRKSFLHNSWSAMNLASEIAGSSAADRIKERITEYWNRQMQRRLIASLNGILADNLLNNDGDMVLDVSDGTGNASKFNAGTVIDACGTLGDEMSAIVAVAVHSDVYRTALKNDLIETIPDSKGGFIQTFRGLGVIVDDGLPVKDGAYTSVLFGQGAIGYGTAAPTHSDAIEVENIPSAGKGGGQQVLHSRLNVAIHPAGFSWKEAEVAGESPVIAELAKAENWTRVLERKAVQLAFLITRN